MAGSLTASLIYAGLGGLINLWLIWGVVDQRRALQIGLGDGGSELLLRRMRMHANAMENLPLQLVLLVLLEASGGPAFAVHAGGIAIVAGRLLHMQGMHRRSGRSFGRFYGTLLSMVATLGLSVLLLLRAAGLL
ncbi:MAG: MAPEG family protein [Xanthomonadales bacterium]|nr:MAPEG family protein [Xanthomonadales bacterium]